MEDLGEGEGEGGKEEWQLGDGRGFPLITDLWIQPWKLWYIEVLRKIGRLLHDLFLHLKIVKGKGSGQFPIGFFLLNQLFYSTSLLGFCI